MKPKKYPLLALLKRVLLTSYLVLTSSYCLAALSWYEKALSAYEQGDIDAAYIHLKSALRDAPDNLANKILMGKVLLVLGNYQEAQLELEEVLAAQADPNLVMVPLAKAFLLNKNYEAILSLPESTLSQSIQQHEFNLIKAAAYRGMQQNQLAENLYRNIIRTRPDEVRAMTNLAALLIDDGRLSDANIWIEKALELDKNDSRVWHVKGMYEHENGRIDMAIAAFEQALTLSPYDPVNKRALASAYVQIKDYANALTLVTDIVSSTPDDPFALMMQTSLLAQQQDYALAAKVLTDLRGKLIALEDRVETSSATFELILGLTAYLSGEYEQARRNFVAYNREQPGNIKAIVLLANTYIALDNSRLALSALESVEKQTLEYLPSALLLCQLYIQHNKTFKAETLLSALKPLYQDNSRVALMDAKILVSRGKQSQAVYSIEQFLQRQYDAELLFFQGLLMEDLGQVKEAESKAKQLLAGSPDNPDYLNFYAAVLIEQGQLQKAEQLVNQIIDNYPEHFAASFNLATLYARQNKIEAAQKLLEKLQVQKENYLPLKLLSAKIAVASQAFDTAISELTEIKILWPENKEAQELLVTLYAGLNQADKAIQVIDDLLEQNSMDSIYLLKKAKILITQKNMQSALETLKLLRAVWSDQADRLFELSQLFLAAGSDYEAEASLASARRLSPDNQRFQQEYARQMLRNNEVAKAAQILYKLVRRDSKNADTQFLLGELANVKGEYDLAHKHYSRAIELNGGLNMALVRLYQLSMKGTGVKSFARIVEEKLASLPEAHFYRRLLADHYMSLGNEALAEKHYLTLVQVKSVPQKAQIYNNLASIFIEKDTEQAQAFVEQSLALAPDAWGALDTKGWILAKQGKFDDALNTLRQAYARNSNSAAIRYHLAYVLVNLDRRGEAKRELEFALASKASFVEREQAQALLDSI